MDRGTLESERQFFDGLVADRGEFNPFTDRGWDTLRRRFVAQVAPGRGATLLDVGCGTGHSRQIYRATVERYVGLDVSTVAVVAARRAFPADGWLVGDACALPFDGPAFDVVAFSSVLHHVDDRVAALREAVRVLRPGGRVFAFDPNVWHPAMALFRHPRSPLYLSAGVSPNERPLRPRALHESFAAAGLVDIRQRCQSDIPYRGVAPSLLNAALPVYNAADWLWEQSGLGRLFGAFVVTSGRVPGGPH